MTKINYILNNKLNNLPKVQCTISLFINAPDFEKLFIIYAHVLAL